jgi:AcrR family transcriptional regulator
MSRSRPAMMQQPSADQAGSPDVRLRILRAARQLYREIGYRKTTVADIARRSAMSSANVYRFFRSRQNIEEVVVAELLDEVFQVAANAGAGPNSPMSRLDAVLRTIFLLHDRRLASDERLHELVAAAIDAKWPVVQSHIDRIAELLATIIETGQVEGEFQGGSAATLAHCVLAAMNTHLMVREPGAADPRPTFDEMMSFCLFALRLSSSGEGAKTCLYLTGQSEAYGEPADSS